MTTNTNSKPKTKRVILKTSLAGHRVDDEGRVTGIYHNSHDDEVELEAAEADRFIAKGYAELIKD